MERLLDKAAVRVRLAVSWCHLAENAPPAQRGALAVARADGPAARWILFWSEAGPTMSRR
jgi:hypothetical protein